MIISLVLSYRLCNTINFSQDYFPQQSLDIRELNPFLSRLTLVAGKSIEANQKRFASCESEIIDAVVIEDDWSEFEKPLKILATGDRNSPLAGLLDGNTQKAIESADDRDDIGKRSNKYSAGKLPE